MEVSRPFARLPPLIGDVRTDSLSAYHLDPSSLDREKSSHNSTKESLAQSQAHVAYLEGHLKWLEMQYKKIDQENRQLRLSLSHLVRLTSLEGNIANWQHQAPLAQPRGRTSTQAWGVGSCGARTR